MARHGKNGGVRPFLKWAGGKSQLLGDIARCLPPGAGNGGKITRYIEPFVGGGAVFFSLVPRCSFNESVICDINEELVLTYRVIRTSLPRLAGELAGIASAYRALSGPGQEAYYYEIRDAFNRERKSIDFTRYNERWIRRAAQIIFLNHTCYNGLFRVNQSGGFNVPFGRYRNPEISGYKNLEGAAALLSRTRILCGDFTRCRSMADDQTFVYLDPPYRPLNATSSFTSYSRGGFSENDQERLAAFFRDLDRKGAQVMLSNSDPASENPDDAFFDELYNGFTIRRVPARRLINCNGARRGTVSELLITNY
ncbi:DNA adenine methylase [Methanoregula boonei 6A8]|uniref:site-specific DNA-methyltransferase (adenine-specific) n=1 Tax=Methanoregula boonei (strain DSM 21154 / JCM 14090 / 6A8) TaxID=456442 RepID=A7I710_METB6|nr:DNA adenine methylase [Methanoregula boonei]ABS55521.1 DNA adenine methylase [Methanoregula boonei 6A8]